MHVTVSVLYAMRERFEIYQPVKKYVYRLSSTSATTAR